MIQKPTKRTLLITGVAVLLAAGLWLGWGRSGGTGSDEGGYLATLALMLFLVSRSQEPSPLQRRAWMLGTTLVLAGGGLLWYVLH